MKKLLTVLLAAAMLLTVLTACGGDKPITSEQAQEIALEDAGLTDKDVADVHSHVSTYENVPCYNIHITVDDMEYNYNISSNGEILSK